MGKSQSRNVRNYSILEAIDMLIPLNADRERLISKADPSNGKLSGSGIALRRDNRDQIWDFFFRIKPDKIGTEQRFAIIERKVHIEVARSTYLKKKSELDKKNTEYRNDIITPKQYRQNRFSRDNLKRIGRWLGLAALAGIVFTFFSRGELVITGLVFAGILSIFLCLEIGLAVRQLIRYRQASTRLERNYNQALLKLSQEAKIDEQKIQKEITDLESQLDEMRRQIPHPPSSSEVSKWLQEDLEKLKQHSITIAKVNSDRMPKSRQIRTPGSLQDSDNWPKLYTSSNPINLINFLVTQAAQLNEVMKKGDRKRYRETVEHLIPDIKNKIFDYNLSLHMFAERMELNDTTYEIELFSGVYFIETLIFGHDMLDIVTCYYDFISGEVIQESVREYFYTDLITVETRKESTRKLSLATQEVDIAESVPTFTIHLSDGTYREIILANENYVRLIDKHDSEKDFQHNENIDVSALDVAFDAYSMIKDEIRRHKATAHSALHHSAPLADWSGFDEIKVERAFELK